MTLLLFQTKQKKHDINVLSLTSCQLFQLM